MGSFYQIGSDPRIIQHCDHGPHDGICRPKAADVRREMNAIRTRVHSDRFIDELLRVAAAVVAVNLFRVSAVRAANDRVAEK
jgi:N-formylglutamate amidohydrolase